MKKAVLVFATTLLVLSVIAVASPAQAYVSPYPVIMVTGLNGFLKDVAPVQQRLIAEGFDVRYYPELIGLRSNKDTAKIVAARVKRVASKTGKVSLACWSAGVMSCRYAMKYLGIVNMVDKVVLYGGGDGNISMCLLPVSAGGDGCSTHPFAISLLLGDDTPGNAQYYFFTSFNQEMTPIPDGGICYKYIPFDGFSHPNEPFQPVYQDAIAAAMHGICAGEYINRPISNAY